MYIAFTLKMFFFSFCFTVLLQLIFCLLFSGHLLTHENISGVLTEVPPLISESDLHISQVYALLERCLSLIK